MTQYKRAFGPQEANNPPAASAPARCQQCGKSGGVCAKGVILEYTSQGDKKTVCYKAQCVFCGAIQYWNGRDKNGEPRTFPAFYVLHSQTNRPLTAYREFMLPPELYTSGNKADVGLKVDIIRSLLRLQVENPTEYIFTLKEVLEGMHK